MIVALDSGNTRIKWGVHDGSAWLAQGALPTAEAPTLSEVSATWPEGAAVFACNVAGERVATAIARALAARFPSPRWLKASASACGVANGYEDPERLGADRWAALIAARAMHAGACLVVGMGTATTIDRLDADGVFRGGLIVPGFDLMREALSRNTAQLPYAEGAYSSTPRNTADAITSGCLHAQLGAIERMFATIAGEADTLCLLTGGAAHRVLPHLRIPLQWRDSLVLDGLVRWGASR
jgi:type III pantothenate kinase